MNDFHAAIAKRLTPTDAETAAMQRRVERIERACNARLEALGVTGQATVQGSIAKGTWIAGSTDIDLFLLLDPSVAPERLEQLTVDVAEGILESPQRKYAQHPYLIGTFDGAEVDLVPAYRVESAGEKMSAVDRTPFHTAWVTEHIDVARRGDVRLAKRWCKGVGIYGAETAIAGFSGYLLEVLIVHAGSFEGLLKWFEDGLPGPVAIGENAVEDNVSPLIVADPVDPARNCAAAVSRETMDIAQAAAEAYQLDPQEQFFWPEPPRGEAAGTLHSAQARRKEVWCALTMRAATDRLDIVFPQFQKAARAYASELERLGFPLHRHQVCVREQEICMQFVFADVELPATTIHVGPRADKRPNANKYRQKWESHPDARGPVEEVNGHLQIEIAIPDRTPSAALVSAIDRVHTGKHVKAALGNHATWNDPATCDSWAPEIADLVLDRRPWQR